MSILKLFGLFEENRYDVREVWFDQSDDRLRYVRVQSHETGRTMLVRVHSFSLTASDMRLLPQRPAGGLREVRLMPLPSTDANPESWVDDCFPVDIRDRMVVCCSGRAWDRGLNCAYRITNPFVDEGTWIFLHCIDLETYYNTSLSAARQSAQDLTRVAAHHQRLRASFRADVLSALTACTDHARFEARAAAAERADRAYGDIRQMYMTLCRQMAELQREIERANRDDDGFNFQAAVDRQFRRRRAEARLAKCVEIHDRLVTVCGQAEWMYCDAELGIARAIVQITGYMAQIRQVWMDLGGSE